MYLILYFAAVLINNAFMAWSLTISRFLIDDFNLDLEPMNCKKIFECSVFDTLFYINFINKMKDRINKTISVHTGQSIISKTNQ